MAHRCVRKLFLVLTLALLGATTPACHVAPSAETETVIAHAAQDVANGKYGDAVASLNDALAKPQLPEDHLVLSQSLAGSVLAWGNSLSERGNSTQALLHYLAGLSIARNIRGRQGEDIFLGNIGLAYESLGKYARALNYEQQALAIAREIKDRTSVERCLDNIGIVYEDLGQYKLALDFYQQALVISREIRDRTAEERNLGNISVTYRYIGQFDMALGIDQQALAIAREDKDRASEQKILGSIGIDYGNLGQYDKALDCVRQAVAVARQIKDVASAERSLGNMGIVYEHLGDYDKALDFDQQALAIARKIVDRADEQKLTANIGNVYGCLGRYDKALDFDQKAFLLAREIKDGPAEEKSLGNIGTVYENLGQYNKALNFDHQALSIATEINDRAGEDKVLGNIGASYVGLRQYDKALNFDHQALAIAREIKDRSAEANSLGNIGVVYGDLRQYDRAIDYEQRVLFIAKQIKDRETQGKALDELMIVWDRHSHFRVAAYYGKQAVNVYQSIRQNIRNLDATSKRSYLVTVQGTYRRLADILVAQGLFGEAEQVLSMLKEQELLEFVRRDAVAAPPADATARYDRSEQRAINEDQRLFDPAMRIAAQFDDISRRRPLTPTDAKKLTALQAQLTPAIKKWNDFLATLPGELKDLPPGPKPELADSGSLQTVLHQLPTGTIVVYAIVLPDHLRLVEVTPQLEKSVKIAITDKKLRKLVFDWCGELSDPNGHPNTLGKQLYDVLVAPIAKDLAGVKAKTVMWWLDDALHYAPVAALWDGHRYMVERYRTTVFTNGTLSLLLDQTKDRQVLGLGVTKAHGDDYPALPGVAAELHAIVRDKDDPNGLMSGDLLMDDQLTAPAMFAGLNHGYPFVHVASHFMLGPNYAMSNLLLGDGPLSLQDIADRGQVFQSVDLLVLSACQTGIGSRTGDGHEVESLANLARDKGAWSILASLWPVADESTPELMEDFYRALASQKDTDKAAALQEAQLALLNGDGKSKPKYASPYYWAPFILMGNWR